MTGCTGLPTTSEPDCGQKTEKAIEYVLEHYVSPGSNYCDLSQLIKQQLGGECGAYIDRCCELKPYQPLAVCTCINEGAVRNWTTLYHSVHSPINF
eukprot:Awhi_evm2s14761